MISESSELVDSHSVGLVLVHVVEFDFGEVPKEDGFPVGVFEGG